MLWLSQIDFFLFYLAANIINWVCFCLSGFIRSNAQRITFLVFGLMIFSLLVSLRGLSVGSDSYNYATLVNNPGYLVQSMEPLFVLLPFLVRIIGGGELIFFFVLSVITNVSLLIAFYKFDSNKFHIYFLLFSTSFIFINMNMNILRQGVAISLATLAISFLYNRQRFGFCFFLFLAVMSHFSAIIVMIFILLDSIRWDKYRIFILFLLLSILFLFRLSTFIEPIVQYSSLLNKLHWYLTWDRLVAFKFKHIYILFSLLLIFYLIFINSENLTKQFMYGLKSLLAVFIMVAIFREDEFLVDRTTFYFYPLIGMMVYELVYSFKTQFNRLVVLYSVALGSLLWILQSFLQYHSWWILGNVN